MTHWLGRDEAQERGCWCVLKTCGRGTLALATSLSAAKIEAWTPKVEVRSRLPRSRARRIRLVPLMPGYVFVRAAHLDELIRLAERPGSHEAFTLFRYFGRLPLLDDNDLEPLRTAEVRAVPRRKQRTFRPGQQVRVPEGNFGGMRGIVEQSDGKFTLVSFGGRIRVKIATFLLREDEAKYAQPGVGTAAKAA